MNFDPIRFRIKYWILKTDLIREFGYSPEKAKQTIGRLRKMDPEILHLFLEWYKTKKLPGDPVNGVTIRELMEHDGLNPVAVFLALNWVKRDPQTARYALSHPVDAVALTQSDEEELRKIAEKRGWAIPKENPEDNSDLVDPADSQPSDEKRD